MMEDSRCDLPSLKWRNIVIALSQKSGVSSRAFEENYYILYSSIQIVREVSAHLYVAA